MIIKKNQVKKVDRGNFDIWVYTESDLKSIGLAVAKIKTRHGRIKSTRSDRIYYILEGKGKFYINEKVFEVEKDDVVLIPKNTPYDYEGDVKVICISSPPFDARYEVNLEK